MSNTELTMSYGAFVLEQILSENNQHFSELPFDIKFSSTLQLYALYEVSEISKDLTKSEYDCISKFLEDHYYFEIRFNENTTKFL